MLYYEVANLVTVTKTNLIDKMPCAYGTMRVASGPIYILLMYSMNPFRRMVTVGHNATVFIYNTIPTEREATVKPELESDMQRNASYWRRARSSLPPGCLWRLWQSASTLTEPFRPAGNVFCWCHWVLCSIAMCVQLCFAPVGQPRQMPAAAHSTPRTSESLPHGLLLWDWGQSHPLWV